MGLLDSIRKCLGIAERVKIRKHDAAPVIKEIPRRKPPFLSRSFTTEELALIPVFANRFDSFITYKSSICFPSESYRYQLDSFENLTRVLSDEEQDCIIKMLDWHKKPEQFRKWLKEQDHRALAQLAAHYSMRELAYGKWLEKKYPHLHDKIIDVIPTSLENSAFNKLQQKHKTTDTVVESISGAGFPIDMGWFLQSISLFSVYLDTLAVGITAAGTIFTLAISFGTIVYWMVANWIKNEEENAMLAYAKCSRHIDIMNEQLERDTEEASALCDQIISEVTGDDPASTIPGVVESLEEKLFDLNRQFAPSANQSIRENIDNLYSWVSDPFEPRTKPFSRSWIIINPLLVGTTLFGGLFFGLYSSVTSILTMLGAVTAATVLTGGLAMGAIAISMLLISCYFAWGNYESMQSLEERVDTISEIEEREYNVKDETARRNYQLRLLKDIHAEILQSKIAFMQGTAQETISLTPSSMTPEAELAPTAPTALQHPRALYRTQEQRDTFRTPEGRFNHQAWWSKFVAGAKKGLEEPPRPRRIFSSSPNVFP